jgi:hypothetical protein
MRTNEIFCLYRRVIAHAHECANFEFTYTYTYTQINVLQLRQWRGRCSHPTQAQTLRPPELMSALSVRRLVVRVKTIIITNFWLYSAYY